MKCLTKSYFRVAIIVVMLTTSSLFAVKYGNMEDSRDGKKYKTVKLGSQTWMAENLNIDMNFSWCYEDKIENCKKYGQLYTWEQAMTACSNGWHLPDSTEWLELQNFVTINKGSESVVTSLKFRSGWKMVRMQKSEIDERTGERYYLDSDEPLYGTDRFGFSALSAGIRVAKDGHFEKFTGLRELTWFWGATESWCLPEVYGGRCISATSWNLGNSFYDPLLSTSPKGYALSVRCIKD